MATGISQRRLQGHELAVLGGGTGSAVSVRPNHLLTSRLHRISIRAARPGANALENSYVRAAVALWRLYFETSH